MHGSAMKCGSVCWSRRGSGYWRCGPDLPVLCFIRKAAKHRLWDLNLSCCVTWCEVARLLNLQSYDLDGHPTQNHPPRTEFIHSIRWILPWLLSRNRINCASTLNARTRDLQINDGQSGIQVGRVLVSWFMLVLYYLGVSASIISLRAPQNPHGCIKRDDDTKRIKTWISV